MYRHTHVYTWMWVFHSYIIVTKLAFLRWSKPNQLQRVFKVLGIIVFVIDTDSLMLTIRQNNCLQIFDSMTKNCRIFRKAGVLDFYCLVKLKTWNYNNGK